MKSWTDEECYERIAIARASLKEQMMKNLYENPDPREQFDWKRFWIAFALIVVISMTAAAGADRLEAYGVSKWVIVPLVAGWVGGWAYYCVRKWL